MILNIYGLFPQSTLGELRRFLDTVEAMRDDCTLVLPRRWWRGERLVRLTVRDTDFRLGALVPEQREITVSTVKEETA